MHTRSILRAVAALFVVIAICGSSGALMAFPAQADDVTQSSESTPVSVSAESDDATLTLSRNVIGNTIDPQDVKLTFAVRAHAGDVYTITIPQSISNGNGAYSIGDGDELPSEIGTLTRSIDTTNNTVTFTYKFAKTVSISTSIILSSLSNYWGQPTPMESVGTSTKTILWTCNNTSLDSLEFTQIIKPAMNPAGITRVSPSPSEYKAIYTKQNYTYQLAVNEVDGVHDDMAYASAQVNSAVNFGTTIRIPVPKYFQLDQNATKIKNGFTDSTTITQPDGISGDLIITVPKGSGKQGWQNPSPYYFVGSYQVDQPQEEEQLVADGPTTIDQMYVDPQGTEQHITATLPAWTEYLRSAGESQLCADGNTGCLSVSIGGNNTTNDLLLTDNSQLTTLNFMGFGNNSPSNLSDAVIEVKVPSGFNATAVVTPASSQKLPNLTSYRYEIKLLDGTVMTGSVDAGGTITRSSDSPMRDIKLYPNMLEAGANTDIGSSCTTLVDNNASCAGQTQLYLQGTLSRTYDDGTAVQSGDTLTTSISMSVPSSKEWNAQKNEWETFIVTSSVQQQVITKDELKASLAVWSNQTKTLPGSNNSGVLSVYSAANSGNPTTDSLYEPVFYYVLPQGTSYDEQEGVTSLNSHDGITAQPVVSTFQATDGRQVVKIDYTGTGYEFSTPQGANNWVHLNITSDTKAGTYPWAIYVVSPQTAMTSYNAAGVPANASYVDGTTTHVYKVGEGTWKVTAPNAVMKTELSQGNRAYAFGVHTHSDDKSTENGDTTNYADPRTMRFAITVSNGTPQQLQNVQEFINIPQQDDTNGFSVQLTGPVTFQLRDGDTAQVPEYTVRYSTQPTELTTSKTDTPSAEGFVTADEVTDWSTIRSLVIEMKTVAASSSVGRFILTGIDPTLVHDAQKTVYLTSGLYAQNANGEQMIPLVTKAGSADAAAITVTGQSTITARLHWTDTTGADQYVDLADLTKTYDDNLDEFKRSDYPTETSEFSETDRALFPEGYVLDTSATTIIGDNTAVYPIGGEVGTAQWNTLTRYNYNGSIVQYELVPASILLSTMPVTGASSLWNPGTIGVLITLMTGFAAVMFWTRNRDVHRPSHTTGGR